MLYAAICGAILCTTSSLRATIAHLSHQVQSWDKVIGVFTIYGYGGHLGHVTLKPYLHQQKNSCLDCVSSFLPFWFTWKNRLTRSGSYNDPLDGAIFDPRGKIGRIYVELHMTMLFIKYTSFVSCCCREDFLAHLSRRLTRRAYRMAMIQRPSVRRPQFQRSSLKPLGRSS